VQKRIDSLLEVKQWDEALISLKEYQKFHGSSESFALSVKAECGFRRGLHRAGKGKTRSLQTALPSGTSQGDFTAAAVRDLSAALDSGDANAPAQALLAELLMYQLTCCILKLPQAAAGQRGTSTGSVASADGATAAAGGAGTPSGSAPPPSQAEAPGSRGTDRSASEPPPSTSGALQSNGIDILPSSLAGLCSTWNNSTAAAHSQPGLEAGSVTPLAALLVFAVEHSNAEVHAAFDAFRAAASQVPIPCALSSDPGQVPTPLGVQGGASPLKGVQLSQHRLWLWQRGLLLRGALHVAEWMQASSTGTSPALAERGSPQGSMHRALVLACTCFIGVWQLCCVFAARTYRAMGDPGSVGALVWHAWGKGLQGGSLASQGGAPGSAAVSPVKPSTPLDGAGGGVFADAPSWVSLQGRLRALGRGRGDLAWRSVLHTPVRGGNPCAEDAAAACAMLADGAMTPLDPLPAAWALPPAVVDTDLLQRMGLRQQAAVGTAFTSLATALMWGGKTLWAAHVLSTVLAGSAGAVGSSAGGGSPETDGAAQGKGVKGGQESKAAPASSASIPGFSLKHGVAAEAVAEGLLGGPYLGQRSPALALSLLDAAAKDTPVSADELALSWDGPLVSPLLVACGLAEAVTGAAAAAPELQAVCLAALAAGGGAQKGLFELGRTIAGLAGALLPRSVPFAAVFRRTSVWRAVGLVCMGSFGATEVGPLLEECAATSRHVAAKVPSAAACVSLLDWQLMLLAAVVQNGACGRPAVARVLLNNAIAASNNSSSSTAPRSSASAAPAGRWWAHSPAPSTPLCRVGGVHQAVFQVLGALFDAEISRRRGCIGAGGGAADLGGGAGVSTLAASSGGTSGAAHVDGRRSLEASVVLKSAAEQGMSPMLQYAGGVAALVGGGLMDATVCFGSVLQGIADRNTEHAFQAGTVDASLAGAILSCALAESAVVGPSKDGVAVAAAVAALGAASGNVGALTAAATASEGVVSSAAVAGLVGTPAACGLTSAPLTLLTLGAVVEGGLGGGAQGTLSSTCLWQLVQVMRACGLSVGAPSSAEDGPVTVSPQELVAQCYASAALSLHTAAVVLLDTPDAGAGTLTSLCDTPRCGPIVTAASGAAGSDTAGLPWLVTAAVHALCAHARALIGSASRPAAAAELCGPRMPGTPVPVVVPTTSPHCHGLASAEVLTSVARAEGLLELAAGGSKGVPNSQAVLSADAIASLMCTVGALHEACGAPGAAQAQFAAAHQLSPGHGEATVRCAWYAVHGAAAQSAHPPAPPCADGASMHLVRAAQRVLPGSSLAWALLSEVEAAAGKDGTPAAVTAAKLLASTPVLHCSLPLGVQGVGQFLPPLTALRSYHSALSSLRDTAAVAACTTHIAQEAQGGRRNARSGV